MTVNRTAGVLSLVLLLAGCTGGTAPTGVTTTPAETTAQTSTPTSTIPTVTTVPGGPTLNVYVTTGVPAPPDVVVGKYRDGKSLCDVVLTRPIKGFTPTRMALIGSPETIGISCILTDDDHHHVGVGIWRGDRVSASEVFAKSAEGNTPVSGIGDKAALTVDPILEVLKDTDYYQVDAEVEGDVVAIEKEIALAVV
ncbi:hypothetical protein ACFQ1S_21925 [Kibdelosporangium lantanae]|uniref:Lipoprotein n=1 Tax=Kibdelosporangium lantanae TaxID=1497396 RepID=A0ABW3MEB8_9PSEU